MDGPSRRAFIAGAVATIAVALGLIGVWVRVETPSLGVTSAGPSAFSSTSVVVDAIPGATSPLQAGDEVLAIDGRSMVAWADDLFRTDAVPPDLRAGDLVSVTVRRDGAMVEVPVVLQRVRAGATPLRGLRRIRVRDVAAGGSRLRVSPSLERPGRRGAPPRLRRSVLERPAIPPRPEPARRRAARAVLGVRRARRSSPTCCCGPAGSTSPSHSRDRPPSSPTAVG